MIMNKKKLLAFLVSSAFLFVGCNEDDPMRTIGAEEFQYRKR